MFFQVSSQEKSAFMLRIDSIGIVLHLWLVKFQPKYIRSHLYLGQEPRPDIFQERISTNKYHFWIVYYLVQMLLLCLKFDWSSERNKLQCIRKLRRMLWWRKKRPSGLNKILTLCGLANIPRIKGFLGGRREAGESSACVCK